jgi:hypothetical protein
MVLWGANPAGPTKCVKQQPAVRSVFLRLCNLLRMLLYLVQGHC